MRSLDGQLPTERARLEIQYKRIKRHLISSGGRAFDGEHKDWLSNAEIAHASNPFRAIVAAANPRTHPSVLEIDNIDETTLLWKTNQNLPIPRKAKEMSDAIRLLLEVAFEVILIDPHFDPAAIRFRRPFEKFLSCCTQTRNRALPRIRLLTCADEGARAGDAYEGNCQHYLAPLIPNSLRCELLRIRERTSPSEKLHNRYVLSDRGGVSFGTGLDDDDGEGGQTDKVGLLSQESFELYYRQYGLLEAFDVVVPAVTIVGTKAL